jgi:GntR family transcriptional regulator
MPVFITLAYGSPTPIYRQIIEQVTIAVSSGQLREGEMMPTVRALAEELTLNHNTIAKAYRELEREGIIGSQSTRGMFVQPRGHVLPWPERRRRMGPAIQALLGEAFLLGLTDDEVIGLVKDALNQRMSNRNARQAQHDEAEPGNRSGRADEVLRDEEGG